MSTINFYIDDELLFCLLLSEPSRPTSSRSVSRGASPGTLGTLLEKLGNLGESQEALTGRVGELEVNTNIL